MGNSSQRDENDSESAVPEAQAALSPSARCAFNDRNVERFFGSWDPGWRWVVLLGMRRLRRDLGGMAQEAAYASGSEEWVAADYVYGPLAYGISAAAVNEAAQHCEDLFALLKFVRRPDFVKSIGSYSAGRVAEFGRSLASAPDVDILEMFMVPSDEHITPGLGNAADEAGMASVRSGRAELLRLVRVASDFYHRYEFLHMQYKHGLKLAFRPYGSTLPAVTVEERRAGVSAPVFAFTHRPLDVRALGEGRSVVQFMDPGPEALPHLARLIEQRELLRIETHSNIDLDEICAVSYDVLRLIQVVRANRLALVELDPAAEQSFSLPAPGGHFVHVSLELPERLTLKDFASKPRSAG